MLIVPSFRKAILQIAIRSNYLLWIEHVLCPQSIDCQLTSFGVDCLSVLLQNHVHLPNVYEAYLIQRLSNYGLVGLQIDLLIVIGFYGLKGA